MPLGSSLAEPMEPFEPWLLRRVAQAVEAGGVPMTLTVIWLR